EGRSTVHREKETEVRWPAMGRAVAGDGGGLWWKI
ncbi:hypothetical protein A2U01_0010794, partial [Trifolium medium]|nr:hypothetical protein [Trifolium medium]